MKRGEIWIVAGGGDYMSKPRPAVVVQGDIADTSESVTICGFTTAFDVPTFTRVLVLPSDENGLENLSEIMVDKIPTVRRQRLRVQVGRLGVRDAQRLDQSLRLFLGLVNVNPR